MPTVFTDWKLLTIVHRLGQAALVPFTPVFLKPVVERVRTSWRQACGITRKTLYALEKGVPGATIGTALTVLWKLGLLDSAAALADPEGDEHGKILEAARRPQRVRHPAESDNDF